MLINRILPVVFFLFTILIQAQEHNKYDTNGKRHGLWKGLHSETNRPRYEGTFNHGKETGIFKYFDDTKAGTVIATRDFSKGDGTCYTIFYNQKSNKVSEGVLKNKLPEGEWKYYHFESPRPMTIEYYKNGKLHGLKKVFYKDGTLAEISNYSNGILNGPYVKYAENSKLLEELNYKNGQLHGKISYYDGAGNIVSKGEYKNGRKSGYWETYKDGKLEKKEKITAYTRRVFSKDNPAEVKTKSEKK